MHLLLTHARAGVIIGPSFNGSHGRAQDVHAAWRVGAAGPREKEGADFCMERIFARDISLLDSVFAFVALFGDRHKLDEAAAFATSLAVEELFVNMVKHDPGGTGGIGVDLRMEGASVVVTLRDSTARPFDPTEYPAYDVSSPIQERTPGGLGIHLVRSLMDGFSYEYLNGENIITLTKHVGKIHV
jgi:serine/threonine-protein kinase RsbW